MVVQGHFTYYLSGLERNDSNNSPKLSKAIATQHELEFKGYNSVIYLPLLEIHPESFEVDFDKHDAVIITSQNAAEISSSIINNSPLFLVGEESAAILYDKNIKVVARDAKELLVKIKMYPYKNYLYLSGDHISTKIDLQLKHQGVNVERKIVYKSIAISHFANRDLRVCKMCFVLFSTYSRNLC